MLLLLLACAPAQIASDSPGSSVVDGDADGYLERVDCDDADASVHPGAEDTAGDGVDADCDGFDGDPADSAQDTANDSGASDTGTADTGPIDADDDGYLARVDCDDADASVHPGANDTAGDGIDQDYVGIPSGRTYVTLDSVSYNEVASWPLAKGFSIELNDTKVTSTDNDRSGSWCLATSVAGSSTDKGSPGAVSSGC